MGWFVCCMITIIKSWRREKDTRKHRRNGDAVRFLEKSDIFRDLTVQFTTLYNPRIKFLGFFFSEEVRVKKRMITNYSSFMYPTKYQIFWDTGRQAKYPSYWKTLRIYCSKIPHPSRLWNSLDELANLGMRDWYRCESRWHACVCRSKISEKFTFRKCEDESLSWKKESYSRCRTLYNTAPACMNSLSIRLYCNQSIFYLLPPYPL